MALFSNVKHGYFINVHGNYSSFGRTIVTLFRSMTGENWNGLMRDTMVAPPFCDESVGNCGYPILAPFVHCAFQVLSSMLLMNLVISVVLEQFEEEMQKIDTSEDDYFDLEDASNMNRSKTADLKSLDTTLSLKSQETNFSVPRRMSTTSGSRSPAANLLQDEASVNEFSKIWAAYSHEYGARIPINRLPGFFRLLMRCNPMYRMLVKPEEMEKEEYLRMKPRVLKIKDIERWCLEDNSPDITAMEIWDLIDALSIPCDGLNVHYFDIAYRLTWYAHCRKQNLLFKRQATRLYFVLSQTQELGDKDVYIEEQTFKFMRGFMTDIKNSSDNDRIHLVRASAHRNWSEIVRWEDWKYPTYLIWRIVYIQRMWRGAIVRRLFKKIVKAARLAREQPFDDDSNEESAFLL